MSSVKAIIFDFDGTLIPANRFHYNAFRKVFFERYDYDVNEAEFTPFFGVPTRNIVTTLCERHNLDVGDLSSFERVRSDAYLESIKGKMSSLSVDIVKTLKYLANLGFKLGIGTGSSRKSLEAVLGKDESLFGSVLTADDPHKGKPNPDLFLAVAEKLNVLPENCAIIEDAFLGIKAAQAAGMVSIAVKSGALTSDSVEDASPDYVLDSVTSLNKLFKAYPQVFN